MNLLNSLAVGVTFGKISSYIILGTVGTLILVVLVLFALSIFAQKKYETDTLPSLAELNPEDESLDIESDEEEVTSAFSFDDEGNTEEEHTGDNDAEELLKDMRAVESAPVKTSPFSRFGKKK